MKDVNLILEKEGLEGLVKAYDALDSKAKPIVTTYSNWDHSFAYHYFRSRLENIKEVAGLGPLLEGQGWPVDEDITRKFRRKEEFFSELLRESRLCYDAIADALGKYLFGEGNIRAFYLTAFDHLLDVKAFEHLLEVMEQSGVVKRRECRCIRSVSEDYAPVLIAHSLDRSARRGGNSALEKVNARLLGITGEHLEKLMHCCEFTDNSLKGYFTELEEKILENRKASAIAEWRSESREWAYTLESAGIWAGDVLYDIGSTAAAFCCAAAACMLPGVQGYVKAGGIFAGAYLLVKSWKWMHSAAKRLKWREFNRHFKNNNPLLYSIEDRNKLPLPDGYR